MMAGGGVTGLDGADPAAVGALVAEPVPYQRGVSLAAHRSPPSSADKRCPRHFDGCGTLQLTLGLTPT